MNEMHELREKLCNELKSYGNKEMTAGSLDVIDKLAHAVKNIDKIINEGGHSYMHRDDMGRYSRGETHNEELRQDIKRLINKMESM